MYFVGSTWLFTNQILVYGTLNIQGTIDNEVLMTSIGDSGSYWSGININASGCLIANRLHLKYGTIISSGSLTLTNSRLEYCKSNNITVTLTSGKQIDIENNEIYSTVSIKDNGCQSFVFNANTITYSTGYPIYVDLSGTNSNNDIYTMIAQNNTLTGVVNGISIGGTLTANKSLPNAAVYVISANIVINSGVSLTILEGTQIYIVGSNTVTVNGTLNISGTSGNYVLITSVNDPIIGGAGTTYWGGVNIGTTGTLNADYLNLKYGKIISNGSLNLTNSIVSNCNTYGITVNLTSVSSVNISNNTILAQVYIKDSGYTSFTFQGNTITNSTGYPVYIDVGGTN